MPVILSEIGFCRKGVSEAIGQMLSRRFCHCSMCALTKWKKKREKPYKMMNVYRCTVLHRTAIFFITAILSNACSESAMVRKMWPAANAKSFGPRKTNVDVPQSNVRRKNAPLRHHAKKVCAKSQLSSFVWCVHFFYDTIFISAFTALQINLLRKTIIYEYEICIRKQTRRLRGPIIIAVAA